MFTLDFPRLETVTIGFVLLLPIISVARHHTNREGWKERELGSNDRVFSDDIDVFTLNILSG